MMLRGITSLLLLTAGSALWAAEAPAKPLPPGAPQLPPQPGLEERLTQLELQLRNQPLLELLARLDTLQQENQQLRGELEEQGHRLDQMKQQLTDSYRDLDRRMVQMERTGGTAATPNAATPAPADEAALAAERDAYQKAFDLMRELRYDQAAEAFAAFLKSYPNGRYAAMAQYWLAESHYARRDYEHAVAEYGVLQSRFPDSPKQPEALLKSGYSQLELNKKVEAKSLFEELVKRYPQSPEAKQAQESLKGLQGVAPAAAAPAPAPAVPVKAPTAPAPAVPAKAPTAPAPAPAKGR